MGAAPVDAPVGAARVSAGLANRAAGLRRSRGPTRRYGLVVSGNRGPPEGGADRGPAQGAALLRALLAGRRPGGSRRALSPLLPATRRRDHRGVDPALHVRLL